MNFFLLILILLMFHGAKFAPAGIHEDYLSREHALNLRGVFTIIIVMTHYMLYFPYTNPGNEQFTYVWTFLDQLVVVVYLFFNGYGTVLSVEKKGWPYARNLLIHKLPDTWLKYALVTCLVLAVHSFMQLKYTLGSVLMAFTGWHHFYHDDQWYVVMILFMYALFFLAYLPLRRHSGEKALKICTGVAAVLCCGLIFVISRKKDYYWYNTMPAMLLGMGWALYHRPVEKLLERSGALYAACLMMCALGLYVFRIHQDESLLNMFMLVILFMVTILLCSMKVSLNNPLLAFFGSHSFTIYLTMRIPMLVLQRYELVYSQPAICLLLILLCSAGLGMAVDRAGDALSQRLHPVIDRLADRVEGRLSK